MPEEPKLPKFRLKAKEAIDPEVSPHQAIPAAKPSEPIKLRQSEGRASHSSKNDLPKVETYLNQAYEPDRIREAKRARKQRIVSIATFLIILLIMGGGTLAYGHRFLSWPVLQPTSWYLPFILAAILASMALLHGIRLFAKNRSISMLFSGIFLAAALSYWNILMLETTANINAYRPDDPFAQYGDFTQKLRIFEINAVKGRAFSPNTYMIPQSSYLKGFRDMPRSDWKPYFRQYLSPTELNKVSVTNIDNTMKRVVAQMYEQRIQEWTDFKLNVLDEPSIKARLIQCIIRPYTYLLERL